MKRVEVEAEHAARSRVGAAGAGATRWRSADHIGEAQARPRTGRPPPRMASVCAGCEAQKLRYGEPGSPPYPASSMPEARPRDRRRRAAPLDRSAPACAEARAEDP